MDPATSELIGRFVVTFCITVIVTLTLISLLGVFV